MARPAEKAKARALRAQGKSYSEIREELGVPKGTLNSWLSDMPLSDEQIRKLRDLNPKRIEHFRATMKKKREDSAARAYTIARKDVGKMTARERFIAGLYLYWAEGTKSARGRNEIANTDPAVIRAFLEWLLSRKVPKSRIRVRLQLYRDMDVAKEIQFWSKTLAIPAHQFRTPSIKKKNISDLSRKGGHGHGTCDLIFENMPMWEYITGALKVLRELHIRP